MVDAAALAAFKKRYLEAGEPRAQLVPPCDTGKPEPNCYCVACKRIRVHLTKKYLARRDRRISEASKAR